MRKGITIRRRLDLEKSEETEILWVEIKGKDETMAGLLIGVVYRRPTLGRRDYERLEEAMRDGVLAAVNEGLEVLIGGDFNAHAKEWDTLAVENEWGVKIKELMEELNLINGTAKWVRNAITYECAVRKSVLDLVFASAGGSSSHCHGGGSEAGIRVNTRPLPGID